MAVSHSNTRNDLTWAIATLVGIIATLAVNTLSNLIPPGGQNVGEIANTVLAGGAADPSELCLRHLGPDLSRLDCLRHLSTAP
jgi:hypothetical protein